ncbi:hypothetical protein GOODEAATRI_033861, partial [Goodea atripinnis]
GVKPGPVVAMVVLKPKLGATTASGLRYVISNLIGSLQFVDKFVDLIVKINVLDHLMIFHPSVALLSSKSFILPPSTSDSQSVVLVNRLQCVKINVIKCCVISDLHFTRPTAVSSHTRHPQSWTSLCWNEI